MNKKQELRDHYTWAFYNGLQLAEFASSQLIHEKLIQQSEKRSVSMTRKMLKQVLNRSYQQAKATRKDVEFAENFQSDTLALMVEGVSYMAQVPPDQVDWMVEQIKKLTYAALNRHKAELKKKESCTQ